VFNVVVKFHRFGRDHICVWQYFLQGFKHGFFRVITKIRIGIDISPALLPC
jgi:hypothetical protein